MYNKTEVILGSTPAFILFIIVSALLQRMCRGQRLTHSFSFHRVDAKDWTQA